jgi:hypothetical protein
MCRPSFAATAHPGEIGIGVIPSIMMDLINIRQVFIDDSIPGTKP